MLEIVRELKYLKYNELESIIKIVNDFKNSLQRTADEALKRENEQKEKKALVLFVHEKKRLKEIAMQRAIMTKFLAGQSYEEIAFSMNYHPKTIYKKIIRFQTDLSILKEIDIDILRNKMKKVKIMLKSGKTKEEIVRKLFISRHYISGVKNQLRAS